MATPLSWPALMRSAKLAPMPIERVLMERWALVAIHDVHSKPSARQLVEKQIQANRVHRLFIEWASSDVGSGTENINDFFRKQIGKSAESIAASIRDGGYFARLAPGDAKPGLIELSALALSTGARVIAADLSLEETLEEVRKYNEWPVSHPNAESNAFSETGFKFRDEHAGRLIAQYLVEGPKTTGRLMLWGKNHFSAIDDFKPGLSDIIRSYRHPRMAETVEVVEFDETGTAV